MDSKARHPATVLPSRRPPPPWSCATAVLGLGILLSACPKSEDDVAIEGSDASSAMGALGLPEGTGPVARVNAVEVPRDLFVREYVQTIERYERARHEVKPALRERLKDNIVRRLVDTELIAQQATKLGVALQTEETEQKWLEHKRRYGSEEAFRAFLERAGTSEQDVRRQFEANLLREQVFARISDEVEVSAEESRAYYEANLPRYERPEQVQASHILIRADATATPQERAEKRKRAEEALTAARAKKADFAELARKYGEDPTRDKGGDLGYFAQGRMVKPFEDAAWKLKVGQLSGIVETPFGFHIIKKIDHQKARTLPFEEVREQIERSLNARKRNQAVRDALATWRQEAALEILVKGDEKIIAEGRSAGPSPGADPEHGSESEQEDRGAVQEPMKQEPMKLNPPSPSRQGPSE